MAARSIGSGVITIALVSIPVKLYSAVDAKKAIAFNQLHAACGSRVKQQLICPVENVVLEHKDTVKGFEYAPDQYVRFTADELKAIEAAKSGAIEIINFIDTNDVPPHAISASFFLGPDKGGDRPYALLALALLERKKVAVARYTKRGRDKLVFVRPFADGLMLQEAFFADECRSFSGVDRAAVTLSSIELQLGCQLVDEFSGGFDHASVVDGYGARLRAAVEEKVAGRDIVVTPTPKAKPIPMNLVDALEASVRKAREDVEKPDAKVDVKPGKSVKKAEPRAGATRRKKGQGGDTIV